MPTNDDKTRVDVLTELLLAYPVRALPGLATRAHAETLARQLVDSLRRVRFAHHLQVARHDPRRADPTDDLFDPLRAAVLSNRAGEVDNAYWLVLLGTHFGKHQADGWRLTKDIYGRLGTPPIWTWHEVVADLGAFVDWTAGAVAQMKADGISRRFSNHRKYESLDHIAAVLSSYVAWVQSYGGHGRMIQKLHQQVGQNPHDVFALLYSGMNAVKRFGRLAKFDYLAMLGKLGISPIAPGSPYMKGATGPLAGARMLFGMPKLSPSHADEWATELGNYLNVGMQEMEDALCNWQKSPARHVLFVG